MGDDARVERVAEALWAYEAPLNPLDDSTLTPWDHVAGGHHGRRLRAKASVLLAAADQEEE